MRSPYLHRALTPSGKAARVCTPQAAQWQPCARCSVTIKRLWRGQIEYLAGQHARSPSRRSAVRRTRHMPADNARSWHRGLRSGERLARMALLATGLFAGRSVQAADSRRLVQSATRRLAAVAVQPQTAFHSAQSPCQHRILGAEQRISARNAAITASLPAANVQASRPGGASGGVIDTLSASAAVCQWPRLADDSGCYNLLPYEYILS